ncbi:hypothetical protein PG993_008768 [Apiospora rasikravindrae]|uniref:Uncharacterized protein n=1 Tax=Apiospora rasikravindrae TaxID=990691 RepID=A0ABR1SR11_9PEZI
MTPSRAFPTAATVVLAAAAVFFGNAQAYQGWPGSNTLVDGDAVRFSQQRWRQHLQHPDAKGEYPVRGYDISQEWPAVREVDGWRLAVNVSNSIPASEAQNNGTGTVATWNSSFPTNTSSSVSAFKGTSISLKGPESVIHSILGDNDGKGDEEVDEIIALELGSTTWKVCVTIATDSGDDKKNASSVSCDRLAPQCVADFERAYAEHFAATEDCAGHPPPTPASCGGALDAASLRTIQYPIDAVNGTEIYVNASAAAAQRPPRGRNLTTAWNEDVSTKMWPVLIVWGWNHRAILNTADGAAILRNAQPLAQLSCIKATSNARPTPTPTATPTTVPETSGRGLVVEASSTSTLTGLALLTVAITFVLFG